MICSSAMTQNNIIYLRCDALTDDISVIADTIESIYSHSSSCILCYLGKNYIGNDIDVKLKSKGFLSDGYGKHIENEELGFLNELMSKILDEYVNMQSKHLHIKGNGDEIYTLTIISNQVSFDGLCKIIDVNELRTRNVNLRFLIYDKRGKFTQLDYAEMLEKQERTYMLNF